MLLCKLLNQRQLIRPGTSNRVNIRFKKMILKKKSLILFILCGMIDQLKAFLFRKKLKRNAECLKRISK